MQAFIQSPARDLQKSKKFYENLGFVVIQNDEGCFATDGVSVLKLNTDAYARPGLILYIENCSNIIEQLKKHFPVIENKDSFQFVEFSGTVIYLQKQPLYAINFQEGVGASVLGNNSGVSLETPSIAASMEIWQLLGFSLIQGSADAGWVTLQNAEGVNISLMALNTCPHLFHNPSLTFFNGKNNNAIINIIRDLNIEIDEEVVVFNKNCEVDNVVLRDPGGVGFFVFND